MKILFLDTETTGLTKMHGIHQISGLMCEWDNVNRTIQLLEEFNFKCAPFPEDIVDPAALKVSGVTEDEVKQYPDPRKVFKEFTAVLARHCDKFKKHDKIVFSGYNAPFDAEMMRAFFDKNGDKYFGSWFWVPVMDVMCIAFLYLLNRRAGMENFKLATVAQTMDLVKPGKKDFHQAQYDIRLTAEIFCKAMRMQFLKDIPKKDLFQ